MERTCPFSASPFRERQVHKTDKRGEGPMPKKGVTGHDGWVITEALATALVALEQLPPKHQPRTQMDDISKLLAAGCQPGTVNLRARYRRVNDSKPASADRRRSPSPSRRLYRFGVAEVEDLPRRAGSAFYSVAISGAR